MSAAMNAGLGLMERQRLKMWLAHANAEIERAFCAWHPPASCAIDGRLSWSDLQREVIRTVARDGEAFVRMVYDGPQGFALQHIDAALVDEDFNRTAGDGVNAVKLKD